MQTIEQLLSDYQTPLTIIDLLATLVSLIGIPWGLFLWYRSRRAIGILIACKDGDKKGKIIRIATLPKIHAVRSEIVGLVTMRAGKDRMDLSNYQVDQSIIGNKVVVPLNQEDFNKWDVSASISG